MFSDLNDLYQELILDHNAKPHNFGKIDKPSHMACGHNPLCGDKLIVFIKIKFSKILDVKFKGEGCAISKAAASMMTDVIKNKTLVEVDRLFNKFHLLLTSDEKDIQDIELLGKLAAFRGVKQFPIRIKCATLAWHTMKAALGKNSENISTE